MSTRIQINITREVLEKTMYCGVFGKEKGEIQENCAIAFAIREIFPEAQVEEKGIFLTRQKWEEEYGGAPDICIPAEAKSFISKFDSISPSKRIKMKDFSFEIEVPDEALSHIDISEVHRILRESKTLSLA